MRRTQVRRLMTSLAAFTLLIPPLALADARPREVMNAGEIELALHKLRVMESALYVGAHPDDENTALLSYLSSGRMVRTAYLSLTRGDGGQNLLGSEQGDLLGVIRTQELLAARRIDGAEQFFTRAVDFGFSKNPEETFAFWGHDEVLSDVVRVIRAFRPDVILTRFAPDSTAGHGHHTASAMLAEEAFTAAADSVRFPGAFGKPWQAKRIVRNLSRPTGADTTLVVDVGAYNPLLGRSYTEIAGLSRSMHKSQGFGAPERRGSNVNGFHVRAGAPAKSDLFEGVNLSWSRIPGGDKVDALLAQAEREFKSDHPEASAPVLVRAALAMDGLHSDEPLVACKQKEIADAIRSCAGLWIEAIALAPTLSSGDTIRFITSIVRRSSVPMTLVGITSTAVVTANEVQIGTGYVRNFADSSARATAASAAPVALPFNRAVTGSGGIAMVPSPVDPTQPYWLRELPSSKGLFTVREPPLIGQADNAPVAETIFHVRIAESEVAFPTPILYRWTDPVLGERYRAVQVVPPATLRLDQSVYVFADRAAKRVNVTVRSAGSPVAGAVRLSLPGGWKAAPESLWVTVPGGAERSASFLVTPAATPAAGTLGASITIAGVRYSQRLVEIDYPHIPLQTLFQPAWAHVVRADIRHLGESVGYVMGSGDQVPDALRQIGYKVTLLSDDDLESGGLARFDAIVIGVRAYNTRPRLRVLQPRLLDYVRAGGTMVAQYNTPDTTLDAEIGPWPFRISRDRVTVEEASVRLLRPQHPLLTRPNRIGEGDFAGWIQERGLNFPNAWDPQYETVLSSNDPGEPPRDGGLLFARYGKGIFIDTSYDWFRELPAGVPGAFRLFANLVSARATPARSATAPRRRP